MDGSSIPTVRPRALDFALAPFCRMAWVSDDARSLWEPRLLAVREALEDLAVLRAAETGRGGVLAVRPASAERVQALAAGLGLSTGAVETGGGAHGTAFGTAGRRLLRLGDAAAAGACPGCVARSRAEDKTADPIWTLAQATPGAEIADAGLSLTVAGGWAANPLLAAIGIGAPLRPCCFACEAAQAEGEALIAAGDRHGREDAMAWLVEMLSWSVGWTALHGIAEIKTAVFRYVRDTPATGERIGVRRPGDLAPAHAAKGLGFPFRARPKGVFAP